MTVLVQLYRHEWSRYCGNSLYMCNDLQLVYMQILEHQRGNKEGFEE
jgi:hypothetical protein